MDQSEASAWVRRVLGVDPGGDGGGPDLDQALAAWRAALAEVDEQITGLQRVLRGAPDQDLQDIAEFGLGAMTGSHKVKLQAALMEASGRNTAAAAKAARLAGAFAAHLNGDKRVAACDGNPFGPRLAIRATLVPALEGLRRALERVGR
jgi:hypothetical protein